MEKISVEELNGIVEELKSIIVSVHTCYDKIKALYEKQEAGLKNLTEEENEQNEQEEDELQEEHEEVTYTPPTPKQETKKPLGRPKKLTVITNCGTEECKHNKKLICKHPGGLTTCDEWS